MSPGSRFPLPHAVSLGRRPAAPGVDAVDPPRLEPPAAGRRAGPPRAGAPAHVTCRGGAVALPGGPERGGEKGKKKKNPENGKREKRGVTSRWDRAFSPAVIFRVLKGRQPDAVGQEADLRGARLANGPTWHRRDNDRRAHRVFPLTSDQPQVESRPSDNTPS